jgi:hypothetical protein
MSTIKLITASNWGINKAAGGNQFAYNVGFTDGTVIQPPTLLSLAGCIIIGRPVYGLFIGPNSEADSVVVLDPVNSNIPILVSVDAPYCGFLQDPKIFQNTPVGATGVARHYLEVGVIEATDGLRPPDSFYGALPRKRSPKRYHQQLVIPNNASPQSFNVPCFGRKYVTALIEKPAGTNNVTISVRGIIGYDDVSGTVNASVFAPPSLTTFTVPAVAAASAVIIDLVSRDRQIAAFQEVDYIQIGASIATGGPETINIGIICRDE